MTVFCDRINNKKSVVNILFVCASFLCLMRFVAFAAIHAYGFIFFGLFFLLLALNYGYKVRYSIFISLSLILALAFIFFYISGNASDNSILYYITVFSFPFIYYCSTILLISKLETNLIIQNIKKLIFIYIIYLFIEASIRVFLTLQSLRTGNIIQSFYVFKRDTIAYTDTNFLGLHILTVSCLVLFLRSYTYDKIWTKYFICLFMFLTLSLSRSVIITSVIILYLMYLNYLLRKKKYILILLTIILSVIIALNLYVFLLNTDGSFRSKLGILDGMKRIYNYDLNNILFGFGFGKGEYSYSYIEDGYGHLHIAVIIGQYGILGVILFITFFSSLLFQTQGKCFYLIMAFIISGFSLMSFDSSLFWSLGIIAVLCKRNNYLTSHT